MTSKYMISEPYSVFNARHDVKAMVASLVEHHNAAVETLYRSRRSGLQAIHAALDVIDLEQPNPPTSALPEWLLIPAENVHFEVTWVYIWLP